MKLSEKIKAMIERKKKILADLRARAKKSEDVAELRSLTDEIDKIIEDLEELKEQYADAVATENEDGEGNGDGEGNDDGEGRGAAPQAAPVAQRSGFNPMASMSMRNAAPVQETDRHDTPEYRNAFMNLCCRGVPIPAELRDDEPPVVTPSDAITTAGGNSAVIPTTTVNEIIVKLEAYGNLLKAVKRLNIQGGVAIPIVDLKPEATWITADNGEKETLSQNVTTGKITFNYYGVECKIAQTLLASVVTYKQFQDLFVPLAVEAIIKAVEKAIIAGDGDGKPLGVIVDSRVPQENVITLSAANFAKYQGWKKNVFGKMKKAYRTGTFYMAQQTFDGYIDGMVDDNGQPIGRINYGTDGEEKYRFGGKTVETVEDDIIKPYDEASVGDVVAVFFKPTDYVFNTNLDFLVQVWEDHDTHQKKTSVILICDGKIADPNGVIIVKKGA